jgi:hypothetical protein
MPDHNGVEAECDANRQNPSAIANTVSRLDWMPAWAPTSSLPAVSHRLLGPNAPRGTYNLSVPWWGPDGPAGSARTPTFVVSHGEPEEVPEGGVHTFVDNPEEALELASAGG